jgi:6-phosphogluconolactonase
MRSFTVVGTADELARRAADIVAERIRSTTATRLVLAGGTTPKRCYADLAARDLPWGRVTILFGDERCVPAWDPESNYRIAAETLLAHAHPATVHRIPAELGPDEAARAYDGVVRAVGLDLVLLGIGPDGHTASLFPEHPALGAEGYAVGVRGAPKPPPDRVSLTLRALREAERVLVLVAGSDKRDAVRRARAGEVPAGLIAHADWLVSEDAAP